MPAEILNHVRYAMEATRGTGITCTNILDIESAVLEQSIPAIRSTNLTGGVFQSAKVIPGVEINRVKVKLGAINWDRLQRILASALDGSITGTGASADKTWGPIKPPALSTGAAITEALKSWTLEVGYANPAAATPAGKLTGCIVERVKFTWQRVGFVTAEIDFISLGTVTDINSFSGTLTADTVAAMPDHSGFSCYIDDTTIGSTADATVISAELEWQSFMAVDENRKRLAIAKQADWSLKLTRFWEAADMIAAYRNKATKKIRVKSLGPVLGGSFYAFTADCYGYIEARPLGDITGFKSEELEVKPKFDATAATDISFGIVNALATV